MVLLGKGLSPESVAALLKHHVSNLETANTLLGCMMDPIHVAAALLKGSLWASDVAAALLGCSLSPAEVAGSLLSNGLSQPLLPLPLLTQECTLWI